MILNLVDNCLDCEIFKVALQDNRYSVNAFTDPINNIQIM